MGNPEPIFTEWMGERVLFPRNVLIATNDYHVHNTRNTIDFSSMNWETINLKNDRCHRAPHVILWMLTAKCSTDCGYCYANKQARHTPLSTEDALRVIEEAHSLNVSHIDVIGGEVFLHKDWRILISKMVELGMSPSYISTKHPISEPIISDLIATHYNNVIQISLDSLNPEVLFETIWVKKDYRDRIIEGIRMLDEAGYLIQIDTILTKDTCNERNLDELAELISTITNFKYWEIRVPEYSLYSSKRFREIQATRVQLEHIRSYVNNWIVPNFKKQLIFSADALNERFHSNGPEDLCFHGGSCGFLSTQMFILPDGKVSACEQLYWHPNFIIGDLKTSSIDAIWQSPKALQLFNGGRDSFRPHSPCHACSFFDTCSSNKRRCVVKVMKAFGQDNWDYPDPRCMYAPPFDSPLKY